MPSEVSNPGEGSHDKNVAWYIADEDLADLDPAAQKLFVNYSHIQPHAVKEHVLLRRDEAWKIFPFPCIGQMRFLDFSLATMPSYEEILVRLSNVAAPTRLLDVGCCLAQDLRRLVADGAPSENLVGLDLEPRFLSLSYDLFADRESYKGQMVAGNILDESADGPVALLGGTIDIAHAASFFHLFDLEGQVKAGVQLVRLMKTSPGALILGRHLGSSTGQDRPNPAKPGTKMYIHCPNSFKRHWAAISERTGTHWVVRAWLKEVTTHSRTPDKKQWMDNRIQLLYFEVRRAHR